MPKPLGRPWLHPGSSTACGSDHVYVQREFTAGPRLVCAYCGASPQPVGTQETPDA